MTDKIKQAAGEYADKVSFRVPFDGSNKFYDDNHHKWAQEAFETGATSEAAREYWEQQGWVRVEDGLPIRDKSTPRMETVLAFNANDPGYKQHIFVARFYSQTGWASTIDFKITHWLPLPSPPKQ